MFLSPPPYQYSPRLQSVVKVFAQLITHINCLLVLIFSVFFRLCFVMFLLVYIYLLYYFVTNNKFLNVIETDGLIQKLGAVVNAFKRKFLLQDGQPPEEQ